MGTMVTFQHHNSLIEMVFRFWSFVFCQEFFIHRTITALGSLTDIDGSVWCRNECFVLLSPLLLLIIMRSYICAIVAVSTFCICECTNKGVEGIQRTCVVVCELPYTGNISRPIELLKVFNQSLV